MRQPRIRMFAGPNGSGKSTIKENLLPHQIGAYLNADELEKQLSSSPILSLDDYHRDLSAVELIKFLKQKQKKPANETIALLSIEPLITDDGLIVFAPSEIDLFVLNF